MSEMRVGVAAVEITPPPGLPLMGNFRDDYLARGSHDPLTAKAIVFEDRRGTKAAHLRIGRSPCRFHLTGIETGRERLPVHLRRTVLAPQTPVERQAVLVRMAKAQLSLGRIPFGLGHGRSRCDQHRFGRRAIRPVVQAEQEPIVRRGPAVRVGGVDQHVFRRHAGRAADRVTDQRHVAAVQHADVDRQEGCLVIESATGPVAAAVNFGLHPAVLAGDNWLYSADFPGQLSAALRRIQGDDFLTLFLNGCCGNVNHVDYHNQQQGRGYGMIERVGYMLAAAAAQAIRTRVPLAGDDIAVATDMVVLERMPVSPDEYDRCRRLLDDLRKQPLPGQVDGLPEAFFADLRLQMHAVQHEPDHVEVMTIRVGDMAVVGLPGEVFCEFGLELKRRSPTSHTLVVELANDAIGYLPTRESFAQGGYEVTVGSTLYAPGAGERLADAAAAQLQRLF